MKDQKPFVNVATACEKILVEKDNVFSVIRIVDVFYIPKEVADMPDGGVPISTLITVRSGDYRGEGELSLAVQTPDGVRNEAPEKWPMLFSDTNTAANIVFSFGIGIRHIGTSWVEVLWNGEILSKFPVTLTLGSK